MFVVIRCFVWCPAYPLADVYQQEQDALHAAERARGMDGVEWVTVMPVPRETTV